MKTLAEQITDLEERASAKLERMNELIANAEKGDRDLNEEEQAEYNIAEKALDDLTGRIERMKQQQARMASRAKPVERDDGRTREVRGLPAVGGNRSPQGPTARTHVGLRQAGSSVDLFARQAMALFRTGGNRYAAAEFAATEMGDDTLSWMLRQSPEYVARAAVTAHTTTDPQAAAPLVQVREAADQFISLLRNRSVWAALPGVELQFGRDGAISIPKQTGAGTAAWVGEGAPIKVTRQTFANINLTPKKLGALTVATQELLDHSNPSAQALVTADLLRAASDAIDATFVDAQVATANRPAGIQAIFTGTQTAASAGNTLANIYTDLRAAKTALANANIPMANMFWLMSESNRIGLEMIQDSMGQAAFPEVANGTWRGYPILASNTVGDIVVLMDAGQLLKAVDMVPQIELSNQAAINMDDAPTDPDIGPAGGVTTPVVSLFQTDQVAVRVLQRLDWAWRYEQAAFVLTGVTY